MQTSFTTYLKTKHPNDLFQCEYCNKTMESSNGLFKHQRSHLYLKHACEVCNRQFQFPGQKSRHMNILHWYRVNRCSTTQFLFGSIFIEIYKKQMTLQNRKTQRKDSLNNTYPVQCQVKSLQKWVPK